MADMASQLEAAAVRLRRAGQDDLARELTAAMRRGVAPVPDEIRAGLKPHLPDRYAGTLAADLDIRTIARAGSVTTDAVVSVYAQSRTGNRKLEAARRRGPHPSRLRQQGALVDRSRSNRDGSPARRRTPRRGSAPNSSGHWKTSPRRPDRRLPSRSPSAARRSSTTARRRRRMRRCGSSTSTSGATPMAGGHAGGVGQGDMRAGVPDLAARRPGRATACDLIDGEVDFDLMEMLGSHGRSGRGSRGGG